MIGLDTNILIRYIAQDDAINSPRADAIMNSLTVDEPGWIALTALAELIWVLVRRFRMDRSGIYTILTKLLTNPVLIIEQSDIVQQAARRYLNGNAEFTDCLVACACESAGCAKILTFDKRAAKTAGMTLA
jgi:predicted nucleic-acid-binding protein